MLRMNPEDFTNLQARITTAVNPANCAIGSSCKSKRQVVLTAIKVKI